MTEVQQMELKKVYGLCVTCFDGNYPQDLSGFPAARLTFYHFDGQPLDTWVTSRITLGSYLDHIDGKGGKHGHFRIIAESVDGHSRYNLGTLIVRRTDRQFVRLEISDNEVVTEVRRRIALREM